MTTPRITSRITFEPPRPYPRRLLGGKSAPRREWVFCVDGQLVATISRQGMTLLERALRELREHGTTLYVVTKYQESER